SWRVQTSTPAPRTKCYLSEGHFLCRQRPANHLSFDRAQQTFEIGPPAQWLQVGVRAIFVHVGGPRLDGTRQIPHRIDKPSQPHSETTHVVPHGGPHFGRGQPRLGLLQDGQRPP